MFGGSGALTVSAGITLVFVLGATLPNWKWVCIACGSIPIAVFALMPLLPETPNYLIMNGEKQRAYEVHCTYITNYNLLFCVLYGYHVAHLRNKKFLLKFLSQQNASKFAIFHI